MGGGAPDAHRDCIELVRSSAIDAGKSSGQIILPGLNPGPPDLAPSPSQRHFCLLL